MKQKRKWSEYQEEIFKDVQKGKGHTVVSARAGSGKTSTIVECFNKIPDGQDTLMTAFNKKIADELKDRAPAHVDVSTLHSFGLKAITRQLGKVTIQDRKMDGITKSLVGEDKETYELRRSIAKCAGLAKGSLLHTPEQLDELIDQHQITPPKTSAERPQFIENVLKALKLSAEQRHIIDFDDMIWFPSIFEMQLPKYHRVFIDETQDLNAAQIAMALGAVSKTGRILASGDAMQCHPAGTMIRTSKGNIPIEKLKDGAEVIAWNQKSQRLVSGRSVEETAVRNYTGRMLTIETSEEEKVRVTPEHKFVTRWVSRDANLYCTYLMWRRGYGFRVGWCQVFDKHAGFHFGFRARIEKADKAWILKTFRTRTSASAYESIVAAKFGIPTITFEPVHGARHLVEKAIKKIFSALSFTNQENGERALRIHGRSFKNQLYPYPDREGSAIGRRTLFQTAASNLMPKLMSIPSADNHVTGGWTAIKCIDSERFTGKVYSLKVSHDATYVADNVVVHNSIYGFRGADAESMSKITTSLKAKTLSLPITYRCSRAVVDLAKTIVPDFQAAPDAIDGSVTTVNLGELKEKAAPGDFILSRTNAPLINICMMLIRDGKRANIAGKDIGAKLGGMVKRSGARTIGELRTHVESWRDEEVERLSALKRETTSVEDTADCLLTLCETSKTIQALLDQIEALFKDGDDDSRIICSSTHKAKGLERERVWLLRPTYLRKTWGKEQKMKTPAQIQEESNLFYVAVTRAKRDLFLVEGDISFKRGST